MCTQPLHVCSCDSCDIERRALIAKKCTELQARFAKAENEEWNRLKSKSESQPMGRVIAITSRQKKVTGSQQKSDTTQKHHVTRTRR
jgi:hypothetical protein